MFNLKTNMKFYFFTVLIGSPAIGLASSGFTVDTLDCALSRTQNPNLVFEARVDKTEYKVRDYLRLDVRADDDLYITVLDHGSNPNKPHRNHTLFNSVFIKSGNTFSFPPPYSKRMVVSEPLGTNTLEVIASVKPLGNVQAASKNVNLEDDVDEPAKASLKTTNCTLSFRVIK